MSKVGSIPSSETGYCTRYAWKAADVTCASLNLPRMASAPTRTVTTITTKATRRAAQMQGNTDTAIWRRCVQGAIYPDSKNPHVRTDSEWTKSALLLNEAIAIENLVRDRNAWCVARNRNQDGWTGDVGIILQIYKLPAGTHSVRGSVIWWSCLLTPYYGCPQPSQVYVSTSSNSLLDEEKCIYVKLLDVYSYNNQYLIVHYQSISHLCNLKNHRF